MANILQSLSPFSDDWKCAKGSSFKSRRFKHQLTLGTPGDYSKLYSSNVRLQNRPNTWQNKKFLRIITNSLLRFDASVTSFLKLFHTRITVYATVCLDSWNALNDPERTLFKSCAIINGDGTEENELALTFYGFQPCSPVLMMLWRLIDFTANNVCLLNRSEKHNKSFRGYVTYHLVKYSIFFPSDLFHTLTFMSCHCTDFLLFLTIC